METKRKGGRPKKIEVNKNSESVKTYLTPEMKLGLKWATSGASGLDIGRMALTMRHLLMNWVVHRLRQSGGDLDLADRIADQLRREGVEEHEFSIPPVAKPKPSPAPPPAPEPRILMPGQVLDHSLLKPTINEPGAVTDQWEYETFLQQRDLFPGGPRSAEERGFAGIVSENVRELELEANELGGEERIEVLRQALDYVLRARQRAVGIRSQAAEPPAPETVVPIHGPMGLDNEEA
jgi:hypothetical protein